MKKSLIISLLLAGSISNSSGISLKNLYRPPKYEVEKPIYSQVTTKDDEESKMTLDSIKEAEFQFHTKMKVPEKEV
jgi:hypothetical protein